MSSMRRLEREVIRNKCYKKDGNYKGFPDAWKNYHSKDNIIQMKSGSNENNTVITRKRKKEQSGRMTRKWNGLLSRMKNFGKKDKENTSNVTVNKRKTIPEA